MARAPLRWALLAAAAAAAVAAVAASAAAMFIQTTASAPASQVADVAELTVQYTVSNDKYAVVLSRAENVQKGLTNLLKEKYGSGDKDVTLLNLYLYTRTNDGGIVTSYFLTVQVRAVVRGVAAAQSVSSTLLPAVASLPATGFSIDSFPGITYGVANPSPVRVRALQAAAAVAANRTAAIAEGLGSRAGRLNFVDINADSFGSERGGRDTGLFEFRASVSTEYYIV